MSTSIPLTLAGKVAIVTGSSRGIGAAIAVDLAKRGAKVMITYTSASSEDKVEEMISEITSFQNGSSAASVKADLALPESPQKIVDATLSAFSTSTIDILVNNAAIIGVRDRTEVTPADFDNIHRVNLQAPFFMVQIVSKHLPKAGGGRIINISAIGSRMGAISEYSVYLASKGGLEVLTRSWAYEFGPAGHTVNTVSPGTTKSDMLDQVPAEFLEKYSKMTPMENRLGTGEDIAYIVSWLAGEESRWVTGQTIAAAGGLAMY